MKSIDLKSKNGITLIALVVTIIVLIILAGISISLLLGNNGILRKAKDGRNNYQAAANEEALELAGSEDIIDSGINGNAENSGGGNNTGKITFSISYYSKSEFETDRGKRWFEWCTDMLESADSLAYPVNDLVQSSVGLGSAQSIIWGENYPDGPRENYYVLYEEDNSGTKSVIKDTDEIEDGHNYLICPLVQWEEENGPLD